MKVIARLTSPLLAISLAAMPLPAIAAQPVEGDAPTEAAPADGEQPTDATEAPAEGAETPAGETPAEGVPAEGAVEGEQPDGTETPEGEVAGEPAEGEQPEGEAGTDPAEGEQPAEAATPAEPTLEGPEEEEMAEPKLAGRPAKGIGMMTTGGILLGLGAGGIGASVALTNCPEPAKTIGCKNQHNRRLLVPIAASVALVGTLLLVVGGIHAARYKKWQRKKKVAVAPTMLPGGGGVAYSMQF